MQTRLFETVAALGLAAPRGILQVGASYGQELQEFLQQGVHHGVLIEPLDAPFQHLAATCRQLPGFVAVQAVCAEASGQRCTFHVASNHGMSSSLLAPASHLAEFAEVRFDQTVEISTHRLDEVIAFLDAQGHQAITASLDTLYMDTQGAELRILRGAGRVLERIRYIFTEVTRNTMYQGAPTLRELVGFLEPLGFTLNNVNFNRHHHGDALFVAKATLGLAA